MLLVSTLTTDGVCHIPWTLKLSLWLSQSSSSFLAYFEMRKNWHQNSQALREAYIYIYIYIYIYTCPLLWIERLALSLKTEILSCQSHWLVPLPLLISPCSVSYQLIGQKSNLIFLPVKLPYRRHSSLNTMSR